MRGRKSLQIQLSRRERQQVDQLLSGGLQPVRTVLREQNENSQSNCFLSVVPVAGGPVEISGAFAAETVCQQHMGSREIDYGGLSRCGARSRGIGASEKRSERTAYLATGFSRRTKIVNALRSNDLTLLNHYDDLYMKAFSEVTQDPLLGRVNVIKKEMVLADENQLAIDLSPRRKPNPGRIKRSTNELARQVMQEPAASIPDTLS
jgi:hypothetical protein